MKVVKIALLVFTIVITVLLVIFSFIMYADSRSFQGASSAFFFLACTSAFSIFFHIKTTTYYPLKHFDKTIVELSKKYWALHVSLGTILSVLGIAIVVLYFKRQNFYWPILLIGISMLVFGIVTLIETYILSQFVVIYKKRLERQEEIDDIGGDDK